MARLPAVDTYNIIRYLIQLSCVSVLQLFRVRVSSRVRVSFSFVILFHFSISGLSYKGDNLQLLSAVAVA